MAILDTAPKYPGSAPHPCGAQARRRVAHGQRGEHSDAVTHAQARRRAGGQVGEGAGPRAASVARGYGCCPTRRSLTGLPRSSSFGQPPLHAEARRSTVDSRVGVPLRPARLPSLGCCPLPLPPHAVLRYRNTVVPRGRADVLTTRCASRCLRRAGPWIPYRRVPHAHLRVVRTREKEVPEEHLRGGGRRRSRRRGRRRRHVRPPGWPPSRRRGSGTGGRRPRPGRTGRRQRPRNGSRCSGAGPRKHWSGRPAPKPTATRCRNGWAVWWLMHHGQPTATLTAAQEERDRARAAVQAAE